MAYTYRCRDFPGMTACPASFVAETVDEVLKHIELHAQVAHGEDPKQWSDSDRKEVQKLIAAS